MHKWVIWGEKTLFLVQHANHFPIQLGRSFGSKTLQNHQGHHQFSQGKLAAKEDIRGIYFGLSPLPGFQWQVFVYHHLLKTYIYIIILVATVTGQGDNPISNLKLSTRNKQFSIFDLEKVRFTTSKQTLFKLDLPGVKKETRFFNSNPD